MMLSIPWPCSNCPSSNPEGPAPMIATFVRNTCSSAYYRLQRKAAAAWGGRLAMMIIPYNNNRKGPLKPCQEETMPMRKALLALLLAASMTPALAQEKTFDLKISHWVP